MLKQAGCQEILPSMYYTSLLQGMPGGNETSSSCFELKVDEEVALVNLKFLAP